MENPNNYGWFKEKTPEQLYYDDYERQRAIYVGKRDLEVRRLIYEKVTQTYPYLLFDGVFARTSMVEERNTFYFTISIPYGPIWACRVEKERLLSTCMLCADDLIWPETL